MNGKRAKELRRLSRLLNIPYKQLKRNYKLVLKQDPTVAAMLQKIQLDRK